MERYHELSLKELGQLANENDVNAITELAWRYKCGTDEVEQDYQKAFEWYTKGAELNDAEAQGELGYLYQNGRGVTQDNVQAFNWHKKAAENCYAWSCTQLSFCYLLGQGTEKDENATFYWARKSMRLGNSYANFHLGSLHEDGIGTTKNIDKAIACYKDTPHDSKQYVDACTRIAKLSEERLDEVEAFTYFLKAAKLGDVNAMISVANRYMTGDGCSIDMNKSSYWADKVAKTKIEGLPYAAANNSLEGHSYFAVGVYDLAIKHLSIALMWVNKCKQYHVDANDIYSQEPSIEYELAKSLYFENHEQEANAHFQQALKLGKGEANLYLVEYTIKDARADGINLYDIKNAIPMVIQAIESGKLSDMELTFAYGRLSHFYIYGIGVKPNHNKAYEYAKKAVDYNNDPNSPARKMIAHFKKRPLGGYKYVE